LEAGDRRSELKGYSESELKKDLEYNYTDRWGTVIKLDSVHHDSVLAVDTVFNETFFGNMNLNIQKIGNTTVLSLPQWPIISKRLLTLLMEDNRREFPVDLTYYIGRFGKTIEIDIPPEYGNPQPLDSLILIEPPLSFTYKWDWNPDSRVLTLRYELMTDDRFSSPETFMAFAKQVIGVFDSPLLFQSD
jgi:hypothetical protein